MLEFGILGPLEVRSDGVPVDLGGPRQRALLAVLLVRANEVVGADALIQALWGEEAPPTASKSLQVAVSRLRQALGPEADRLQTAGGGYRLIVERDELEDPRDLSRWRGPALADLRYEPALQAEVRRLEELRAIAIEDRIQAALDGGEHANLVADLETFAAEYPLRERLRGQQMLALYRAGRHADALAAYQDARAALDELGLEPGPGAAAARAGHPHPRALARPRPRRRRAARPADADLRPRARRPPRPRRPADDAPAHARRAGRRRQDPPGHRSRPRRRRPLRLARPVSAAARIPAAVCDALGVARGRGASPKPRPWTARSASPRRCSSPTTSSTFPARARCSPACSTGAAELTILATSREPLRVQAERLYPVAPLDGRRPWPSSRTAPGHATPRSA